MGAVILKSFWETLPGRVIQLATLVAAVATLLAASRGIGRLVWNSVTRDYQITRDLALLSCGVQVDHFQHVLGRPPQFVNRSEEHVEHVFVLRDAYVQTVTDLNNKVLYFSITTRTPRFHPTLEHYAHEVTLGHTTFEQLGYEQPDGVLASLGARRFSYSEAYYFGNPGGYHTFVYSMNDAGYTSGEGLLHKVFREDFGYHLQLGALVGPTGMTQKNDVDYWLRNGDVEAFRRSAVINTFTLVGEGIRIGSDPNLTFGPDLDQVRTLPSPSARRQGLTGRVRDVLRWPPRGSHP